MFLIKKINYFLLVLKYLIKNFQYDFKRGTNTQMWGMPSFISSQESDSLIYMGTLEEEIIESTKKLESFLGEKIFSKSRLIDLGSGKGRVLITWRDMYPNKKSIIGIEYNNKLNNIAIRNFKKLDYKSIRLISADASLVNIHDSSEDYTVFFMYNPFGCKTIINFFKKNISKNSALIYFNPVHHETIKSLGFYQVLEKKDLRSGSNYKIYINHLRNQ